jgi:hypothetical protein
VGEDTGTQVNLNHDVSSKFTGMIHMVTIELKPSPGDPPPPKAPPRD